MRHLPVLALCLLAAQPALAAATPWQEVAPGARLRLVSSGEQAADGSTTVGLELDMPDGYTTYWRHPGESGIPTTLDIAGSRGVATARIDWPYPSVENVSGVLDYVYRGPTVLPVRLTLSGDAPVLALAVTMGVCSEVCVPVRARFELPLAPAADPANSLRLRQAESQVPMAWDGKAPAFAALTYQPADATLSIEGLDPAIDPGSIIVAAADPGIVFDTPKKGPDGHTVLLKLRGQGGTAWVSSPVDLTFLTRRGAYQASAPVRVAP
ncbi:MAG TPA: protein-disulfide reductase DsbD domain-containing protein [Devosia sp.]|nr:protein-disulfide reductase DsbD domain-containing protein [Devosia sp.]